MDPISALCGRNVNRIYISWYTQMLLSLKNVKCLNVLLIWRILLYTITLLYLVCPDLLRTLPPLLASVTQFRYLLLTVFPFTALRTQPLLPITNGSLNVRWQFKFKTGGTELPATEASSRSLCCTNNARLHFVVYAATYSSQAFCSLPEWQGKGRNLDIFKTGGYAE